MVGAHCPYLPHFIYVCAFFYPLQYSWASLVVQLVKNLPAMWETWVRSLVWEDPLEKGKATHSSILGFLGGSAGKESACNAGNLGSISGLGGSPEEEKGYPLQYSGLENSMDCIDYGVAKGLLSACIKQ